MENFEKLSVGYYGRRIGMGLDSLKSLAYFCILENIPRVEVNIQVAAVSGNQTH
jgi:hypothetical protein